MLCDNQKYDNTKKYLMNPVNKVIDTVEKWKENEKQLKKNGDWEEGHELIHVIFVNGEWINPDNKNMIKEKNSNGHDPIVRNRFTEKYTYNNKVIAKTKSGMELIMPDQVAADPSCVDENKSFKALRLPDLKSVSVSLNRKVSWENGIMVSRA